MLYCEELIQTKWDIFVVFMQFVDFQFIFQTRLIHLGHSVAGAYPFLKVANKNILYIDNNSNLIELLCLNLIVQKQKVCHKI